MPNFVGLCIQSMTKVKDFVVVVKVDIFYGVFVDLE